MNRSDTLDVAHYLPGLRFGRYHLRILILCSLVTFFDGQDFSALAYALPYIRDDMRISDEMTGYVSSAAFLGQMIGSLLGSYMSDIVGRRPVIVVCTIGSAILTFGVGFASSPEQLVALRFISGLGIGGLLAPVWALSIESMPRRIRATSVTIIMMGFSVGTASAGPIANWVAPTLGWEGIFWVCGIMTGLFALILFLMLPESTRWAVATDKPPGKIVAMLAPFNPAFVVDRYAKFALLGETEVSGSTNPLHKLRELFAGPLKLVTPLIWGAYFCSSFAIYLMSAYAVIFMEHLGIARQSAAWLASSGAIMGALGGIALLAATERRGPGWIAVAPVMGVPLVLLIGTGVAIATPYFVPVLLLVAVTIGTGHAAVISVTSIYYPSIVRATGGGWASFVAKFAAVAAPIFGFRFLAGRNGAMAGYAFTAVCLLGLAACVLALAYFARALRADRDEPAARAQ